MTLALEYHRSPARYLAARGLGAGPLAPMTSSLAGSLAPLRLANREEPRRPTSDWVRARPRLAGICGSDLALLTGRSSPYLAALTSMPFVPGHEVVLDLLDDVPAADGHRGPATARRDRGGEDTGGGSGATASLPAGTRVVIDPVLSCSARGLPPCSGCRAGRPNRCDHVIAGRVCAGVQTGFCADTSGGWSEMLIAHRNQLHPVPEAMPDERAVLVEPLACALRSVRRVPLPTDASVLVLGGGTVGLLTVLALRTVTQAGAITVVAKYEHQRRRAYELGATEVLAPDRAARGLRRSTGGSLHRPERGPAFLLGGADLAFECTGSGLDMAARLVRAGGTVVLSGMPSGPVDLTPAWYRELSVVGSYASRGGSLPGERAHHGREDLQPGDERAAEANDFGAALQLAGEAPLGDAVDAAYPLAEWRRALEHALSAGRSGSVKIAFDPRKE